MLLDVVLQLLRLSDAIIGKSNILSRTRQFGKLGEHVKKEESQPHTFAAPLFAHPVHAVIPVAAAHQGDIINPGTEQPVREHKIANLLKYCELDTKAMVEVVQFFKGSRDS